MVIWYSSVHKEEEFIVKNGIKSLAVWLIIGVILIVVISSIMENSASKMTYSELVTSIDGKAITWLNDNNYLILNNNNEYEFIKI